MAFLCEKILLYAIVEISQNRQRAFLKPSFSTITTKKRSHAFSHTYKEEKKR
jgi:hypothetical protein